MSRRVIAVISCVLVCAVLVRGSEHWDDDHHRDDDHHDDDNSNCPTFDFFVFTRQWPVTSGCTSNCLNAFTIHGMWPSNDNGNDPSYCGAKFDVNALDPIKSQLEKEWPSYQGEDSSFWSHEFEKHGSCACGLSSCATEFDFFNTTLAIHQKYPLLSALSKGGVSPGGSVSVSDIVQAVETAYGGGATVQCDSGKLVSIEMCLDHTFSTVACPKDAMQGTCTESSVEFPTSS